MVWLKLVHIAAISVWCAGMLGLPLLFLRRNSVRDEPDLNRLHRLVRRLYVVVMSPAAFLAVASGTGLIFLRATYAPWFGVKLGLVGLLVAMHVLAGLVIIRLFDPDKTYAGWRMSAATAANLAIVLLILVVVLAKPDIPDLLPAAMSRPGALGDLLADFIPFPRS